MNHQQTYNKIIYHAQQESRIKHSGIYYEKHHIIPKCIGGTNDVSNLVLLTAKEHFICHKLLTYIYKNRKIYCAFHLMAFMNKKKYILSSRDYKYARELCNSLPIIRSEETKIKLSTWAKERVGEKNSMFGKKHSLITKQMIGIKSAQKIMSYETKQKMSLSNFGEKNGMFGKKQSDEVRQKIKIKLLGRTVSEETRLKHKRRDKCKYCGFETNISNLNRYHNENCKYKN